MAKLFEAAVSQPALLAEIVDAMKSVAQSDDPLHGVQAVTQNRSAAVAQLARIAAAHGLDFQPEGSTSANLAAAQRSAMEKIRKENPDLPPVIMWFIGAALMFAPSVFKSVGGTIFGSDTIVPAIEGIAVFGG